MRKMLLISIAVLIMFLVGCSEQAKQELVSDLKEKVENIEKEEYDKRVAEQQEEEPVAEETTPEEEVPEEEPVEEEEQEPEETASEEAAGDDSADDCNLLTIEDIKEVCGVSTTKTVKEPNIGIGQICETQFVSSDPLKAIKIFYSGDNSKGTVTPKDLATQSCDGMKGELITDYSCYSEGAGKAVFVYGNKRNVIISNMMPMDDYFICSREQLKELGKLVSDRIFG